MFACIDLILAKFKLQFFFLLQLDVLLNGLLVQELCTVVHVSKAKDAAKRLARRLSEIIPRQQFSIAIQVVNGTKVLSRENLKPYRKDVTQKLVIIDISFEKLIFIKIFDFFYTEIWR